MAGGATVARTRRPLRWKAAVTADMVWRLRLTQAVGKLDLIWSPCCAEREFQRFFALRVTTALKIQGAYVPRRLFTQPGPIGEVIAAWQQQTVRRMTT